MRAKLYDLLCAAISLPLAILLVLLTGCAGQAVEPADRRAATGVRWASQCYSQSNRCSVLYQRPRKTTIVLEDVPSS